MLKYILLPIALAMTIGNTLYSQTTINLWQGYPPDSKPNQFIKESSVTGDDNIVRIHNVINPTLTIYKAKNTQGKSPAVIICPGGGYKILAWNHEGTNVAEWLSNEGVTALVLKYRLPDSNVMKNKSLGPLEDLMQALKIAEAKAEEWNIDTDKIGVMGFSAGGHLAASGSTLLIESKSVLPDFSILIYPVISMNEPYVHLGSRINLLGINPSEDLIATFSLENQVSEKTPPTFIVHADDDEGVMVENSLNYYKSLREHSVPTEIYIPNKGGHGFGLKVNWMDLCVDWMKRMKIL